MGSTLAREARETPDAARRQIVAIAPLLRALGDRLRAHPPTAIVTCARGSSDHAALYGKYLIETATGRVVASVGPSVASSYRTPLALDGALVLAVSQSGRSPDLVELARAARSRGALVAGILNATTSPLASECELVVPLAAGPEHAIAATKSCLLAMLAMLQLVAEWTADRDLRDAVERAPDALAAACARDWSEGLAPLATAHHAYVLGRGLGLGAAMEVALKLKETCALHAEGFSTAEVLHGPLALVGAGFPIVALAQTDETLAATRETLAKLVALGADVRTTIDVAGASRLPTSDAPAVLAPLCQLQSCYLALTALARARGVDPDRPRHLAKVTETR